MRSLALLAVLVGHAFSGAGGAAHAQEPPATPRDQAPTGRYNVAVIAGQTLYDETSAIEDAPFGGIEAKYAILPNFGIGGYLMASRPTTDATFFPMVRLAFGDTIYHLLVSQQLTAFDVGVTGFVRAGSGRVHFEGGAGIGRYILILDPQRNNRPVIPGSEKKHLSGMQYSLGGQLTVDVGASGALRLGIRDLVYTDYNRGDLDLSDPLLASVNVPHPRPDPPAPKSTIHNLRFEAGFQFTPGGR